PGACRLIARARPVRGSLRRLSAWQVRLAGRGLLSSAVRLPLRALLARLIGLAPPSGLAGLVRLPWPVRLVLAIRLCGPIQLTGLIGPLQVRLPLQPGLLLAALGHELSSDLLRRECLPHEGAVARGLLRRNRERHGSEPPDRAGADRKAGRCARQRSKLGAAGAEHLDASDRAVSVRIELDRHVAAATGRHVHETGRATDAERGGRRRDLHVAGLSDEARHERSRAAHHVEQRRVLDTALFEQEVGYLQGRARSELERRFVVKCNGEGPFFVSLQQIALVDGVAGLEVGYGRTIAKVADVAADGGDAPDRSRRLRRGRRRWLLLRWLGRRGWLWRRRGLAGRWRGGSRRSCGLRG